MALGVLFVGAATGHDCGEKACNVALIEHLKSTDSPFSKVTVLSSTISDRLEVPGRFRVKKMLLGLVVLIKGVFLVPFFSHLYMTPGLSLFGVLRFIPIALVAKLFGRRVVVHYHGSRLPETYERSPTLLKKIIKVVFSSIDGHIFLTSSLRSKHCYIHDVSRSVVVSNFVDDPFFLEYKRGVCKGRGEFEILFLSNLIPEKGWEELISAFEILKRQGAPVSLSIAGAGSETDVHCLERRLRNSPYSEYIKYLGPVFGKDKIDLFHDSDFFVLPTRYPQEGLPLVLLEALVSGCFVITSRKGGIPDVIRHGENGLLIDSLSPEAIAQAISLLIGDCSLREKIATQCEGYKKLFSKAAFCQEVCDYIINSGDKICQKRH